MKSKLDGSADWLDGSYLNSDSDVIEKNDCFPVADPGTPADVLLNSRLSEGTMCNDDDGDCGGEADARGEKVFWMISFF